MTPVLIGAGLGVVGFFAAIVGAVKCYRKVDQGQALIVNKMSGDPEVTFTGGVVWPIVYRAEVMDISVKSMELDRRGKEGLICQDNIRADIKVAFFVRVNKTKEDVLKVAQSIGCARASDQATLEELFVAKFSEALKTVGKRLEFEQLYTQRDDFKDQIIEVIGKDLNGYVLEDAAIDYLEQTPLESLDPDNILDAQGIRKITKITAEQAVFTNDLRQQETKEITRQNVEAQEQILELKRREEDAKAKQAREIATMQAREAAETSKVQAEESRRAELARVKATEEVEIAELNKQRQVQVADKDRERVVAIKHEQVERDRHLEIISRERDTELQRIEKEKAVEVEKKAIADVVRSRVAVDKTVAEEEERIKDLRATAEAKRNKDVTVIAAEAAAEEALVKDIKAAEASEKAAEFAAREKLVLANASYEASDKEAAAKIRLAEGVQAETAAPGLAQVKVKEADAHATERQGMARAKVTEATGMAEVKVRDAGVEVTQREGRVQADITREQMLAEAKGREEQGKAEAIAIAEKMAAEASGLAEKTKAMQELKGHAKEHEEFRLKLENLRALELAAIEARTQIAEAQARVMAEAFTNADIKIVGGDGQFFDRFVKAVSLGESVDGFVDSSDTVQGAMAGYLNGGGDKNLLEDLKGLAESKALSGENLRDLSLSAVLAKLAAGADGDLKSTLEGLVSKATGLEKS